MSINRWERTQWRDQFVTLRIHCYLSRHHCYCGKSVRVQAAGVRVSVSEVSTGPVPQLVPTKWAVPDPSGLFRRSISHLNATQGTETAPYEGRVALK